MKYDRCYAPTQHDERCRCGRGMFVLYPGGCLKCGTAAHKTEDHEKEGES